MNKAKLILSARDFELTLTALSRIGPEGSGTASALRAGRVKNAASVLPAIGDLRYATRDELHGLAAARRFGLAEPGERKDLCHVDRKRPHYVAGLFP